MTRVWGDEWRELRKAPYQYGQHPEGTEGISCEPREDNNESRDHLRRAERLSDGWPGVPKCMYVQGQGVLWGTLEG